MLKIYREGDYSIEVKGQKIDFVDDAGRKLFKEGAGFFKAAEIDKNPIVQSGKHCHIFSWMGDKVVNTLVVLLISNGFEAGAFGGVVEVRNSNSSDIRDCLVNIANQEIPNETELAEIIPIQQKRLEKYDEYLPENLLIEAYGRKAFSSAGAKRWISSNLELYNS
jgi:ATP-dependent Lhr-like helicase